MTEALIFVLPSDRSPLHLHRPLRPLRQARRPRRGLGRGRRYHRRLPTMDPNLPLQQDGQQPSSFHIPFDNGLHMPPPPAPSTTLDLNFTETQRQAQQLLSQPPRPQSWSNSPGGFLQGTNVSTPSSVYYSNTYPSPADSDIAMHQQINSATRLMHPSTTSNFSSPNLYTLTPAASNASLSPVSLNTTSTLSTLESQVQTLQLHLPRIAKIEKMLEKIEYVLLNYRHLFFSDAFSVNSSARDSPSQGRSTLKSRSCHLLIVPTFPLSITGPPMTGKKPQTKKARQRSSNPPRTVADLLSRRAKTPA